MSGASLSLRQPGLRGMMVGSALAGPYRWYTVMSSSVYALVSSPSRVTVAL